MKEEFVTLTVRLSKTNHEILKKKAIVDFRSLKATIERILCQHINYQTQTQIKLKDENYER
jgi:predicted HicB family RNase H-like nuclease